MAEFGIYTETLLIESIRKTRRRWAIDNYTNSSKIDIIIILTTNLKSKISINKDNSISIHCYQVAEIYSLDIDNINNVSQDIVTLW